MKYLLFEGFWYSRKEYQVRVYQSYQNYDYNSKTYQYVANQSIRIFWKIFPSMKCLWMGYWKLVLTELIPFSFIFKGILQSEARQKAILNAKMKAEEYA